MKQLKIEEVRKLSSLQKEPDTFRYNLEYVKTIRNKVVVSGWAFDSINKIIKVQINVPNAYSSQIVDINGNLERADVLQVFKDENALYSGFSGYLYLDFFLDNIEIVFSLNDEEIKLNVTLEKPDDCNDFSLRKIPKIFIELIKNKNARQKAIRAFLTFPFLSPWKYSAWLSKCKYALNQMISESQCFENSTLDKLVSLIGETPKLLPLKKPIDIVIPVYNGMEYLEEFFGSVIKNTDECHKLIIIDDCSTDKNVYPFLEKVIKQRKNCILIKNELNLGFVKTFNKGYEQTQRHFVCLNTDTVLPPFWLERLIAPILANPNVASVTPFTNSGTICSFPETNVDNLLFCSMSTSEIDTAFMKIIPDQLIEIPTCIGFCAAFNKSIFDKIGKFDEIFSPGYGEENDWSMRAIQAGYKNVVATNLFVNHKHGGSFKTANINREKIRQKHIEIINDRYPTYSQQVQTFIENDPLDIYRALAIILLAADHFERRPILIIDHDIGGGANKYRKELIKKILDQKNQLIILLIYEKKIESFIVKFNFDCFSYSYSFEEFEDLDNLLQKIPLEEIFYNNLVSYPQEKIDEILTFLAKQKKIKTTVTFHDFFPLCPSYTLLNDKGRYCEIPGVSTCKTCLANNKFAVSNTISIVSWREKWERILSNAENIICFSESSRQIVQKAYPELASEIKVIPHHVDQIFKNPVNVNSDKLTIGFVGAINYAKGSDVILELAKQIEKENLDIKLVVLGTIANAHELPSCITVHGAYKQKELPNLVKKYSINFFFFTSIWPETFSYVTSELLQSGLPVFSFDIGAQGEKIKANKNGRLLGKIDPVFDLKKIISENSFKII